MVFSLSLAMLIAPHSNSYRLVFAIFVGSTDLTHGLATAFTHGLPKVPFASKGLLVRAALVSLRRARASGRAAEDRKAGQCRHV